jgi:hypothetical protein
MTKSNCSNSGGHLPDHFLYVRRESLGDVPRKSAAGGKEAVNKVRKRRRKPNEGADLREDRGYVWPVYIGRPKLKAACMRWANSLGNCKQLPDDG